MGDDGIDSGDVFDEITGGNNIVRGVMRGTYFYVRRSFLSLIGRVRNVLVMRYIIEALKYWIFFCLDGF